MATLQNINSTSTGYLKLPSGTTAQRPGSPAVGMLRWNTSTGTLEYYTNGSRWEAMTIPFFARTIITTAYMMGGYKDAVAWNNVNRTVSATDTTVNLGDNSIDRSFNYKAGACSRNIGFVFGAGNGHAVSSNYVTCFNMRTEAQYTNQTAMNLANNRGQAGAVFLETYKAWIGGSGTTTIEEFNLTTETRSTAFSATLGWSGDAWAMSNETYGIFYYSATAQNFTFSTTTISSRGGTLPSAHEQQKSVQSKYSYSWAGNEGSYNGGNTFRRTNFPVNTTTTGLSKPVTNSGEENFTLGQDWQYMIGMYNGAQNNISWRFNYATESGFQGSSTMEPKGKAGASSGVCSWRD